MPPTWNTTGMRASSARAHTGSRPTWLGEWSGGHPDATSRAAAPVAIASSARAGARSRSASGHVAGGQQPGVDGAELDHAAVVRAGRADREVEIVAVLPVVEPPVVERVEHELAGEAEQVERPRPVLGEEAAGGGEVLAGHDLGLLDRAVLVGAVLRGQPVEGGDEVALLLVGVAGLAQLVAARVAQRLDAVADGGVGVVAQPRRRLHDVGVGVVDDEARLVVRHRLPLGRATTRCASVAVGGRLPGITPAPSMPPDRLGALGAAR